MGIESSTIQIVQPTDVYRRIDAGHTFVANIVAAWCPDCTERQALHIEGFAQQMKLHDIDVLQVNVQLLKGHFLDALHEQFTARFGGHGYPRTVLIHHGNVVDQNNVEVITEDKLAELAIKFIKIATE